jgi:hypothetical protein
VSNAVVVGVEGRSEGRNAVVPAHTHPGPPELHPELELLAAARTLLSDAGVLRCASHHTGRPHMHGLATKRSA